MKVNKVMMQFLKALSSEDPRLFENPSLLLATVSSDCIVLQKVRH